MAGHFMIPRPTPQSPWVPTPRVNVVAAAALALPAVAGVGIAQMFQRAADAYRNNPVALQLRQMNILYEGLKQKGGMMVVPSSIVDSMGSAGMLSMAALAAQKQRDNAAEDALPQTEAILPPRP